MNAVNALPVFSQPSTLALHLWDAFIGLSANMDSIRSPLTCFHHVVTPFSSAVGNYIQSSVFMPRKRLLLCEQSLSDSRSEGVESVASRCPFH